MVGRMEQRERERENLARKRGGWMDMEIDG